MVQIQLFIELFVQCLAAFFLEVRRQESDRRVFRGAFLSDAVDVVGIFPAGDGHDGPAVFITLFLRVAETLLDAHLITAEAASAAFLLRGHRLQLFEKFRAVPFRNDQADVSMGDDGEIALQLLQTQVIFLFGIDVVVGVIDRHIEVVIQQQQRIDAADTAAGMKKKPRPVAELMDLFFEKGDITAHFLLVIYEHRVTEREETVSLGNCFLIGIQDQIFPGEG